MENELKSCPFCGGESKRLTGNDRDVGQYWYRICNVCCAKSGTGFTEEEADKNWNMRCEERWISAKHPPARGEVVSVTVLEDNDRYEYEAYIHEISGRGVYPASSGTSIAGQVIAWRPKATPYMGEY